MATAYDHWKTTDDRISAREQARAEFVAERTAELTEQRLKNEDLVADALSEHIGYEEGGEALLKSLARFRSAYHLAQTDCGIAEAARLLALELDEAANGPIARDASTDAEHEAFKAEQAGQEARYGVAA